ncbi:unnamed protein product [Adineta ricciae]|uniref:Protein tyrosine phosphatase n=1 Tax=Adineta ricciae TaxID=249248 RepID=A0A813W096_ADIRI|nr:unnamed protein product [Adineta ricciae]
MAESSSRKPKRLQKFLKLTKNDEEEIFQEYRILEEYEVINTLKISLNSDFCSCIYEKKRLGAMFSESNTDPKKLDKYRYVDIRARGPWKDTAIHLTGSHRKHDYINANLITMLHKDRDYIACQGPLQNTCEDFWDMILQYRISKIVMLTKTHERHPDDPSKLVEKCFQYFPKEINIALKFSSIIVQVIDIDLKTKDLEIRHLQITRHNDQHTVIHFYFTGWPDFDVIEPGRFLALIDQVNRTENCPSDSCKSNRNQTSPPMVVHCSAGVGRTGTYIAIDVLMSLLDCPNSDSSTVELDVMGTVHQLRLARNRMVQTKEQYLLLYRCVKEQLERMKRFDSDVSQIETSDKHKLDCKGHPCIRCNRCRDWYFTGDPTTFDWLRGYKHWTNNEKLRYNTYESVIHHEGRDYHREGLYGTKVIGVTLHRYYYHSKDGSNIAYYRRDLETYHNEFSDLCLCKDNHKN